MLIVVSPAKSLDYESPLATKKYSEPMLLDRSEELVGIMAGKSPRELSKMMGISPSLAETNFERFQDWERPFTPANARPAVLAFQGDVYMGMEADTFTERDFTHAQKTLRILSGMTPGVGAPSQQPILSSRGSTAGSIGGCGSAQGML